MTFRPWVHKCTIYTNKYWWLCTQYKSLCYCILVWWKSKEQIPYSRMCIGMSWEQMRIHTHKIMTKILLSAIREWLNKWFKVLKDVEEKNTLSWRSTQASWKRWHLKWAEKHGLEKKLLQFPSLQRITRIVLWNMSK